MLPKVLIWKNLHHNHSKGKLTGIRVIEKTLLLSIILLGAFFLRIDSKYYWGASTQELSIDGEPYVLDPDGYFYLNEAKELLNNTYSSIDKKRGYPDFWKRPSIPPLLSVLLSTIVKFSNLSLNYIGVYLPCFLGLSIAFPLFLWGKYWGGDCMAFSSVTLGLLLQYYASRTSIGRLDTDCLNVTFALGCAYFFLRFAKSYGNKRYLFLIAGILCYLIFLWWWDGAPAVVTAFSLSPLLVALIFSYRPSKTEFFIFCISILTLLSLVSIIYSNAIFIDFFSTIQQYFHYISKQQTSDFPNIGITIGEQRPLPFLTLIDISLFSIPIFLLSATGWGWMIMKKKWEVLFLMPLFIVGLFSLVFAKRFGIFFTPVLALSFGFFISRISLTLNYSKSFIFIPFLALSYIGWQSHDNEYTQSPQFTTSTISGMKRLASLTPSNSVIWCNWDAGHPLIYWSDRATIHDGMVHSGQRSVYGNWPLASNNYRFAANFMQFYISHGITGINTFVNSLEETKAEGLAHLKTLLEKGPTESANYLTNLSWKKDTLYKNPQQWLGFLFPHTEVPIYLFLNETLISNQKWIYWYGTWDISTHKGNSVLPSFKVEKIAFDDDGHIMMPIIALNYKTGSLTITGILDQPVFLEKIITTDKAKSVEIDLFNDKLQGQIKPIYSQIVYDSLREEPYLHAKSGRYVLDINTSQKKIILMDEKRSKMLINRLYLRKDDYDHKYFQAIDTDSPEYQIWLVKGDQMAPAKQY